MKRGYVEVYTGDGKGKTTAAFGVAVRMLGAGYRVYIGQFLKKGLYSEIKGFTKWGNAVHIEQFGSGEFIIKDVEINDQKLAEKGLKQCRDAVLSGKYGLVVLDEINVAVSMNILPLNEVLKIIKDKPETVEIILTGRNAPKEIISSADLVTEMVSLKHYYDNGVKARIGIEE
ncbi:MAG: cob(I)yrinic acid a,c-diamide adenosyltransferase [Spirochaetales bacterium]|nr:cob(I)yrinic acid a,c-diamide adenosyltransferase [Spirochaetales bacterium]